MKICCYCGAPIVGNDLGLPRIKDRIFKIIYRRPGIDAESLRAMVWAGDPNGGPENRKAIHVHINQLNKKWLAPHGLIVRGHPTAGYRVRAVPQKCEVA